MNEKPTIDPKIEPQTTDLAANKPYKKWLLGALFLVIVIVAAWLLWILISASTQVQRNVNVITEKVLSTAAEPITLDELKSATYEFWWGNPKASLTLNDGFAVISVKGYDETFVIDKEHVAFGDLTGNLEPSDDTPNAAVVLMLNSDGINYPEYLFIMGRVAGKVSSLKYCDLADRIQVESVNIEGNQAVVGYRGWENGDYGSIQKSTCDLEKPDPVIVY